MMDDKRVNELIERLRQSAGGNECSYTALAADALAALLAENERLRNLVQEWNRPVPLSDWQKLQAENERLQLRLYAWPHRLALELDDIMAERDRLRAELAAAQKDKRELLQQLRFIRTHLYAATVQRSPADDKIISDHVEQAYLRANEVIESV